MLWTRSSKVVVYSTNPAMMPSLKLTFCKSINKDQPSSDESSYSGLHKQIAY